ncbi:MAG: discoidin domain-containing protein, partial [Myxococcaceae bacterium]|nr:discoidin domain-containing protein [Myxococcaceae bacterium]
MGQTAPPPTHCTTLPVTAVTASSNDGNLPANTIDTQLGTRWSALGRGQYLRVDLGSSKQIDGAAIAWYQGNARSSAYVLETSTDGATFTWAKSASSTGTTLDLETNKFTARAARYLRITVNGNTINDWASIAEVRVCAAPVAPPPPAPTAIAIPQATQTVTYPAYQVAKGAFANYGVTHGRRYRLKYELMPSSNFDFVHGGKLPGLAGGTAPT